MSIIATRPESMLCKFAKLLDTCTRFFVPRQQATPANFPPIFSINSAASCSGEKPGELYKTLVGKELLGEQARM